MRVNIFYEVPFEGWCWFRPNIISSFFFVLLLNNCLTRYLVLPTISMEETKKIWIFFYIKKRLKRKRMGESSFAGFFKSHYNEENNKPDHDLIIIMMIMIIMMMMMIMEVEWMCSTDDEVRRRVSFVKEFDSLRCNNSSSW